MPDLGRCVDLARPSRAAISLSWSGSTGRGPQHNIGLENLRSGEKAGEGLREAGPVEDLIYGYEQHGNGEKTAGAEGAEVPESYAVLKAVGLSHPDDRWCSNRAVRASVLREMGGACIKPNMPRRSARGRSRHRFAAAARVSIRPHSPQPARR